MERIGSGAPALPVSDLSMLIGLPKLQLSPTVKKRQSDVCHIVSTQ